MLNPNQIEIIQNLSNSEREFNDNVKAFLTFGHLFESNIAVTLAHTYCISGKPALNADAMAGAVRRYTDKNGQKICAAIWEEVREDSVTVFALRRDELEIARDFNLEIKPKSWTYTLEDAKLRGTLNQRAWKTMPKVMMHKRALTALLRLAFPEIIGTACSPDELAEVMIQDEQLRDEIVFNSVESERIPKPPTVPPQKKKSDPVKPYHQRINPARDLTTINRVIEELKKENCDIDQSIKAMEYYTTKPLTMCNELELNKLFYSIGLSPIRIFLQEGKKDLSRKGFNEWNAADLETLSSLYESFYGCTMNLEKDKSLQDYISRITNLSDGPLWSEVMIRCRKLHNSGKMTQSQVSYYEDLVSHNPYDLSYYFKFDRDLTTIENT